MDLEEFSSRESHIKTNDSIHSYDYTRLDQIKP